jgi:prevent-host-death family protein
MIDPKDIVTVSELQDRLAPTLNHVRKTGRPVVVTQRGKPAGVLLGIEDYARLTELADQAELEEMIRRDEEADANDDWLDWEDVKKELLARLQGK